MLRDFADPNEARADRRIKAIPRRPGVPWWLGAILAAGFAVIVTPAIIAERWLLGFGPGAITEGAPAPLTVRAPMLAGYQQLQIRGGVVIARGEPASRDQAQIADAIADAMPRGPAPYVAVFGLALVLGLLFSHHLRRSARGRLLRVQLVSFAGLAALAIAGKALSAGTAVSALVVPVAAFAMVPTLVLDRTVGLATGVLAALIVSLLGPFDVGLAALLLVQAVIAGLVIPERPERPERPEQPERPRRPEQPQQPQQPQQHPRPQQPEQRWRAALLGGAVATACTTATYLLITYLTAGRLPAFGDPLHAAWLAAALGPALAALITVPAIPWYQRLVGEITLGRLLALEALSHPLLRQIADRAPGTWQHSLMMANMAERAASACGASGLLVRVGAYYHDLGKSLSPRYFVENLTPGETSPHDQLPPEVSATAIFAHVTEGIVAAREAGLHERIIDFMHMHHGSAVLEPLWARCLEQGNPRGLTVDAFTYPGHPPQTRETAILAIADAVEVAARALKHPEPAAIDALVERVVFGQLHLGQLDASGLSLADLRRIADSLRDTLRHANPARAEPAPGAAAAPGAASVASVAFSTTARPARQTETIALGPAQRIDRDPARAHAFAVIEPPASATLPGAAPAAPATGDQLTAPRLTALHAAALDAGRADQRAAEALDTAITQPSLPTLTVGDQMRLDTPVRPRTPGLAARIEVAMTRSEPRPTAEVDPDDIEAAIEVAPPARRAHPAGVIRPRGKKPGA